MLDKWQTITSKLQNQQIMTSKLQLQSKIQLQGEGEIMVITLQRDRTGSTITRTGLDSGMEWTGILIQHVQCSPTLIQVCELVLENTLIERSEYWYTLPPPAICCYYAIMLKYRRKQSLYSIA